MRTLMFGLLDALSFAFFFLPFLGQRDGDFIWAVNWFQWPEGPWTRNAYAIVFLTLGTWGVLQLVLHLADSEKRFPFHRWGSLGLHSFAVILFSAAREPYWGTAFFLLLLVKGALLLRND